MRRYLVAGGCVSGVARLLSAALSLVTWHVTRHTSHKTVLLTNTGSREDKESHRGSSNFAKKNSDFI